ncbi:hypothetical protein QBC34DRAFT_304216 [Podospora aff. communis PSN243]|uniref:Rhodopsin domain-containing protein n=1 Tax=Podospora aff. communis PSN243 TaxID=3040156 RepID=A0AAV9GGC1_9PEZI|nr:hypothetical protein QBC34DRAFT_304216 [Podospora aff. communis PSN243]
MGRTPPPEVRATWPPPNFVDPETRGPALLIVELIVLPISLLVLLLRMYVRCIVLKNSGWDDWLMVAASVFGTGVTICVILANALYGWNVHVWDLTLTDMIKGRQVSLAAQALFVFATSFAKISILMSYLRFAPANSWFKRVTQTTIATIAVGNSVFLVVLFTQCAPMSAYWDILRGEAKCNPEGPPLMAQAIFTVMADFAVWVLPLPTLMKARLPPSQRIALIVLFSCGLFVVFGAIMRTYWIWVVVEETYDVTWEGFHLWIWTAVEVHLGLICGCIPTLKALVSSYASEKRRGSKPVLLGDSAKSLGNKDEVVKGGKWSQIKGSGSKTDGKTEDIEMSPTSARSDGPGSDYSAETRDTRDTRVDKYL